MPRLPTLGALRLPKIFQRIAREESGLILVGGPPGSGKSTTLAALLNEINETRAVQVTTFEDPIKFRHMPKKARWDQRERGREFDTFPNGLREVLRKVPGVILVDEVSDRETVEQAMNAAETGHLVLGRLRTMDCGQTVNRILGMFEADEHGRVRMRLAGVLRWIVCVRLAPREGGGRHALLEIMGDDIRTRKTIQKGESEWGTFYGIIESQRESGWRTFDQSCVDAYADGFISRETALLHCLKTGVVSRRIDEFDRG